MNRDGEMGRKRRGLATTLAAILVVALAPIAGPAAATGAFTDDDGNVHEAAIEEIAALGITRGCNPPTNDRFCPDDVVTRGQMAAFLVRTFSLTDAEGTTFADTDGSVFRGDIDRLATAGITRGCNPPTNSRFCPDQPVTRGQMAAFLVRALGLTDLSATQFTDTTGHIFAADISRLAAAGITRGCNPPTNSRFCPDEPVRRGEMATFLSRAHDINTTGTTSSTTASTTPESSTTTTQPGGSSTTTSTSPTTTTTTSPGSISLRVVTGPLRHNERPLAGARLAGNIYVMAVAGSQTSPTEVRFWVDNPNRSGPPDVVEGGAPWDLGGTDTPGGAALAWNTASGSTALADGSHSITATAYAGQTELATTTANFTIDNAPAGASATDQVHLSWTGDTATTMTVVWRTNSTATASQVRWRPTGSQTWTTATGGQKSSGVGTGTLHQVGITGLSPDTSYQFQVAASGGGWSGTRTFRTAPGPTGTFDAIYFADTGLAGRTDGLGVGVLQAVSAMNALNPDLLLPGGDYAYNATGQCAQSDGRFATNSTGLNHAIDQWFRQMDPLINDTPMMPTYGNHEVLLCEGFPAWADRFATPTGVPGPNPGPNQHGYDPPGVDSRGNYSFRVGSVHFISLTAVFENNGIAANQFTWLGNEIEAALDDGAQWVIPYFHAAPISHGDNHFHNTGLRNQLAPLFEEYEIPLVLFSHDQSYERTYPLTGLAAGSQTNRTSTSLTCYTDANPGVVWLKVSPSGKHSNKSESFSPWRSNPASWVARHNNTLHHFTRVTAGPNELRVRTYGHDGLGSAATVVDDFRITTSSC